MTTTPEPVNPYTTPEAPAGTNSLARASFIIAIVLVVVSVIVHFVTVLVPVLMMSSGSTAFEVGLIFGAINFISLLLGVVGFVLGLLGARRPGSLLQAGIGIGVGGYVAIGALVALVAGPIASLAY